MTVYLDNNATTLMPKSVQSALLGGCNLGNPSATPQAGQLVGLFKDIVAKLSRFTHDTHQVIITSGASESNSTVINMVMHAFLRLNKKARIMATNVEHKSILALLSQYEQNNFITQTLLPVSQDGRLAPATLEEALRKYPETALVLIMHANNETGSLNDIHRLSEICHTYMTPLFVDAVQVYGKYPLDLSKHHVDGFSFSMHKLYGPQGIGGLVLNRKLIADYSLEGIIGGTQNDGFRGGTENLCGISASIEAFRTTFHQRDDKNKRLAVMREYLLGQLQKTFHFTRYETWLEHKDDTDRKVPSVEIVSITPLPIPTLASKRDVTLPPSMDSTLLIGIINRKYPDRCGKWMRDELQKMSIYVSVGSACNAKSTGPSHVLQALNIDPVVASGALRISIGDYNTPGDIDKLIKAIAVLT